MAFWTKDKRRKYAVERRQRLRDQHLCLYCQSKTDGKAYCQICSDKRSKQQSVIVESRKVQGLCIQCGCAISDNRIRCRRCLDLAKVPRAKRRRYVISHQLCPCCGNKTSGKKSCDSCLEKGRDREKNRREFANRMGICCQCRKADQLQHASVCQLCYLKTKSRNHLGDSRYWNSLLDILKLQDWRCPYTDEGFVLGLNDSIDHKFPRTKFPEQAMDISNLEWTTRSVNQMKADRTPDEFLKLIKQIHDYCSL